MKILPPFRPRTVYASTPQRLYVLAIEDDPNIRGIIELSLHLDPFIVVRIVASGWEGIEEVERSPVRFDLILLDALLPDMSGVALIEALHADPRARKTPVIALTAMRTGGALDRLADAGVIAVMEKPFDPIGLADRLRSHLARRGGSCDRWWAKARPTR